MGSAIIEAIECCFEKGKKGLSRKFLLIFSRHSLVKRYKESEQRSVVLCNREFCGL